MSWALLGGAVFVIIILIGEYSRLVQLRDRTDSLRSEIDEYLKRLHELKTSEPLAQVQTTLRQTEETIQNLRRDYNALAGDLNARIQAFPVSHVAGRLGFHSHDLLEPVEPLPAPNARPFTPANTAST